MDDLVKKYQEAIQNTLYYANKLLEAQEAEQCAREALDTGED